MCGGAHCTCETWLGHKVTQYLIISGAMPINNECTYIASLVFCARSAITYIPIPFSLHISFYNSTYIVEDLIENLKDLLNAPKRRQLYYAIRSVDTYTHVLDIYNYSADLVYKPRKLLVYIIVILEFTIYTWAVIYTRAWC